MPEMPAPVRALGDVVDIEGVNRHAGAVAAADNAMSSQAAATERILDNHPLGHGQSHQGGQNRPQFLLVIGPKLIRDRIMEGAFDDADFAVDLFVRAAQDIPDQNGCDQKADTQKRQEDG